MEDGAVFWGGFFVNGAVAFELLVQCALVGGKKEVSILILW